MGDMLCVLFGVFLTLVSSILFEQMMVWLLKPAQRCDMLTLLPLTGERPDLEQQLRWQHFCMRSHPCRSGERLLIVDCGTSKSALQKAELFCHDRHDAMVCTPEQLHGVLKNDAIYKAVTLVLY